MIEALVVAFFEEAPATVGKTTFYPGDNQTHPLFRIEPGIPCQNAREQASELMGYPRDLSIDGLMEDKPQLLWASHYLCALAKALLDDAELGMMKSADNAVQPLHSERP